MIVMEKVALVKATVIANDENKVYFLIISTCYNIVIKLLVFFI
jgi:hypothetical protein